MPAPPKVIIDTDPGVDDAIAILMALASPSVDVLALTTVGGNVPLARTTRNALALLEYAGRTDVPVARGSARPTGGSFGYAYAVHGISGLTRRLPRPKTRPVDLKAVDFLAARLRDFPGQITLIALGPLTNLAWLWLRHPGALEQTARLVVMGGAVNAPGNVTPHAEFNFYSDPEAAALVLSSGVPVTLVDLAACRHAGIDRQGVERLATKNCLGRLAIQLLANWFRREPHRERFEFYDPLALAVALEPQLVSTYQASLKVDSADPIRLGESRITGLGGPIAVAHQVDSEGFFTLMQEILGIRFG
jgi:inosine-uridine nucleoside N-ribohydrolase